MIALPVPLCLLLVSLSRQVFSAGQEIDQSDDGQSGTISFSTPDLSDDDAHSQWMPDTLKCDACRGISYQLWTTFNKYNDKRKSKKYNIGESDVIDLTETLCLNSKVWQGYGMKEVHKVKRISGEGLETADHPGITAGGGKWPARMMDMCENYMGELGEMEVYDVYKKKPTDKTLLEDFLCYGKGIRNECNKAGNTAQHIDAQHVEL